MILVCNGTRIGLNHVQDFLLKTNQIAQRLMMFSHVQKVAYMLSSIGGIKPANLLVKHFTCSSKLFILLVRDVFYKHFLVLHQMMFCYEKRR